MTSERENLPFVSVIIPVLNAPTAIARCLEALLVQTYPPDLYEIVVVDNGSEDQTANAVRRYPVRLLVENSVQSSYAARNLGIQEAKGEVIALTDSDCLPVPEWLERGVRMLYIRRAPLVAGKVTFTFSPRRSAAELFDSISNMQIQSNVRNRNVAKTANLFVAKHVFESIGLFDTTLRSGGDVLWTRMATDGGFDLVYASDAEVYHPARKLGALLRKQVRVGRGQIAIWRRQGMPTARRTRRVLSTFRPPSHRSIRRRLLDRHPNLPRSTCQLVWLVGWAARIATNVGRVAGIAEEQLDHP